MFDSALSAALPGPQRGTMPQGMSQESNTGSQYMIINTVPSNILIIKFLMECVYRSCPGVHVILLSLLFEVTCGSLLPDYWSCMLLYLTVHVDGFIKPSLSKHL